jgi:hypothetical protein
LTHVENDLFITDEVKIHGLPVNWTLVNEQEAFEGEGDFLIGHDIHVLYHGRGQ